MASNKKLYTVSTTNNDIIEEFIKFKRAQRALIRERTLYNIKEALKCLSNHFHPKEIKKLTEKDLIEFFGNKELFHNWRTRDTYAINIMQFYRWIHNTPKNSRPPNMQWFEYTTPREKRRTKKTNQKKELLIEPKDYEKMLTWSLDRYGQTNAIWETYYLSGIRPEELPQLKIKDISIDNDNIVTLRFTDSKSMAREIPLPLTPYKLLEYLENHPFKNDKDSPLFFPFKSKSGLKHLSIDAIRDRFRKMKKDLKLKPTLKIESFRKTRVTIVLSTIKEKNLDTDDIGKIFGWTPQTVTQRIQDYKLSDIDDLKKKYSKYSKPLPSYSQLKKFNETTNKEQDKEIEKLNKNVNSLENKIKVVREKYDSIAEHNIKLKAQINDQNTLLNKYEKEFKELIDSKNELQEKYISQLMAYEHSWIKILINHNDPIYKLMPEQFTTKGNAIDILKEYLKDFPYMTKEKHNGIVKILNNLENYLTTEQSKSKGN